MTEFLKLPLKDQAAILQFAETKLDRPAQVLQKDIWVVWALEHLFSIETNVKMAFKGGTSLSKVYGVINRFSEDVDITLDYRDLNQDINPFEEGITRNRINRVITPQLRELANQHVRDVIAPSLTDSFKDATGGLGRLEVKKEGEEVFLHYPSEVVRGAGYIEDRIKLEFGGRNSITPSNSIDIKSDIAQAPFPTPLEFPTARITKVLSAERTFWEKATLIHAECHRSGEGFHPNRKSRHWHDLYRLLNHEIGQRALEDRELLEDVVKFKDTFYHTGYANFEAALNGNIVLIPQDDGLNLLRNDYKAMIDSGMFESNPPDFDDIVETLHQAEERINGDHTGQETP